MGLGEFVVWFMCAALFGVVALGVEAMQTLVTLISVLCFYEFSTNFLGSKKLSDNMF